jgi:hypothetical protein
MAQLIGALSDDAIHLPDALVDVRHVRGCNLLPGINPRREIRNLGFARNGRLEVA